MSLSRQDLADALGLSLQQVWRLGRRGMPLDSIRAAREWRAANLDPAQAREYRQDAHHRPRHDQRPAPSLLAQESAATDALAVELVARLAECAARDYDAFAPALATALRAVPLRARARLRLPLDVLERMIEPKLAALDLQPNPAAAAAQSDADADAAGAVLLALAAGDLDAHAGCLVVCTDAGRAVLAAVAGEPG